MVTEAFTIGKITGVHGLGGNLKIRSYAQSADTFCPGRSVLLKSESGQMKECTIIRSWPHKKSLMLALEEVENRNMAESLVGFEILVNRKELPETDGDTWYWQDLLGLDVLDTEGAPMGKIVQIMSTGAHDVLVIHQGKEETLIPMHRNFVKTVDLENRTMVVAPPEEM